MHTAVAGEFIDRPYAGDAVVFQSLAGEIGYESAVRRRTHRIVEDGMGDGGHIFCSNNAITSSVPPSNYVAMQQPIANSSICRC
ncbi:MAG: hypothetical protein SVV80_02110 [Planctomycetota bacterium]|nr:hypothetical protein [Planctomycetota bacterium]